MIGWLQAMTKLFVSYKRGTDGVRKLQRELERAGYEVWIDLEAIAIGDTDWHMEVERGLEETSCVIVCMTLQAGESENVQYEVKKALELGKPVFPVLMEKESNILLCLKQLGLPERQHVENLSTVDDWEYHFERLLAGLRKREIHPHLTQARNLRRFEELLVSSPWSCEEINGKEVWVCNYDAFYQIEVGEQERRFSEEWTRVYPAANESWLFNVTLTIQGVAIKQVSFVNCDGGRIRVPVPQCEVENDSIAYYYWVKDTLDWKLASLIGKYYIYKSIQEVARMSNIRIVSFEDSDLKS